MKSKVQFDLTGQNDAVITARISYSDDVRDKVARSIKEKLSGSQLMICHFVHDNAMADVIGSTDRFSELEIRPLPGGNTGFDELAKQLHNEDIQALIYSLQYELNYRKRTNEEALHYRHLYHGCPSHRAPYAPEDHPAATSQEFFLPVSNTSETR